MCWGSVIISMGSDRTLALLDMLKYLWYHPKTMSAPSTMKISWDKVNDYETATNIPNPNDDNMICKFLTMICGNSVAWDNSCNWLWHRVSQDSHRLDVITVLEGKVTPQNLVSLCWHIYYIHHFCKISSCFSEVKVGPEPKRREGRVVSNT